MKERLEIALHVHTPAQIFESQPFSTRKKKMPDTLDASKPYPEIRFMASELLAESGKIHLKGQFRLLLRISIQDAECRPDDRMSSLRPFGRRTCTARGLVHIRVHRFRKVFE